MKDLLMIVAIMLVAHMATSNVGTWIRYTAHYVVKFKKLKGIDIKNLDGNWISYVMVLGSLTILPDSVLDLIKKKELKILYGKTKTDYIDEMYSGVYQPDNNLIFIHDDGLRGNWDWQATTMIHEVGHFVDYSLGHTNFNSCADLALHNIYGGEHIYYERYSNGEYYTNNIREYFAQSFAEYFVVNGYKNKCPLTASYIEDVINQIS